MEKVNEAIHKTGIKEVAIAEVSTIGLRDAIKLLEKKDAKHTYLLLATVQTMLR